MRHFQYFPTLTYNNKQVTDIFTRLSVVEKFNNLDSYANVILAEGLRPDGLANDYYNDFGLAYIFFYSNNIIDPLFDLPLDRESLNKFLRNKYNTEIPERCFVEFGKIRAIYVDTLDNTIIRYTVPRNSPLLVHNIIEHPLRPETREVVEVIDNLSFRIDAPFSTPFPIISDNSQAYIFDSTHSYYDKVRGKQIDYTSYINLSVNERMKLSFYEYEVAYNESKRRLKIASKQEANKISTEIIDI